MSSLQLFLLIYLGVLAVVLLRKLRRTHSETRREKSEELRLLEEVAGWLSRIPKGRVITYPRLVRKTSIDDPAHVARLVQHMMEHPTERSAPWWRVVRKKGTFGLLLGKGHDATQKQNLTSEGIAFGENGLPLEKFEWRV